MFSKISRNLNEFFRQYVNSWVIFAIDTAVSVVSSIVVLVLLNYISPSFSADFRFAVAWVTASFAGSFIMFTVLRCHHIVIRHSTLKDVFKIGLAILGKVIIMGIAVAISRKWHSNVLLLALFLDFVLPFCALIIVRSAMVMAYDALQHNIKDGRNRLRIIVYGTSEKSVAMVTRLSNSTHYQTIGFIDYAGPQDVSTSYSLQGLPVRLFETKKDVEALINQYSAGAILFVTDSDAKIEQDRLVRYATSSGIKVLISPSIDEVVGGRVQKGKIREININDLLGREEIKISMDKIVDNFNNRVVLVTGAAGSIGSEICRQIANLGPRKLLLFDNGETAMHNLRLELEESYPNLDFLPVIGDVRSPERVDYAFRKWRPQVVFHAAAYKHVPLMEENPCEAVLVNVCGSRNVANACLKYDVEKMVMISTDKAVNPTNVMGCTKRLAEIYVQSLGLAVASGQCQGKTRFVTTRFGNVLGSNGSVIPRFRDQIAKGGPVTVTHPEINRFFMTIPEACRLVMEAATISSGNQIVVFDMGEPVKIVDLARHMIELAGFTPNKDIMIEFTGLRPGEKLYEEVLATSENTEATSHDRIRVAKVRDYSYEDACDAVASLEKLAHKVDIPELISKMREIVPEYDCKWSRESNQ